VYLKKKCPSHGFFKTIVWRGSLELWKNWNELNDWEPEYYEETVNRTLGDKGCPFDCGMCPEHLRNSCLVVLEVTNKCNLKCRVCFASANERYVNEPDLIAIEGMYRTILKYECKFSIPSVQLSGGEPTIRDDLPEIIALGKKRGIPHIIVNTNGLRIANEAEYAKSLKESGLDTIYLQFDAVDDGIYMKIRGDKLLKHKIKAIKNCANEGIGVVLVPTISPLNLHQIKGIIQFALKWIPTIHGIMFQPMSYFGRYPITPTNDDRITIPDLLHEIEKQMEGRLRINNFVPIGYGRGCETGCGFACMVLVDKNKMMPITTFPEKDAMRKIIEDRKRYKGAKHVRELIQEYWSPQSNTEPQACLCKSTHQLEPQCLSISAMLFQDVWNIDIKRLKKCCVHVVTPNNLLIPFCAFNVTSIHGTTLYRHQELGGIT
jgi:uncharacterized radical SAM superfamily Fe-S cluster-containing enzyme